MGYQAIEPGTAIWVETHYRNVTEVISHVGDAWEVYAKDERDDQIHKMKLTVREETPSAPKAKRKPKERKYITPEQRQARQSGLICKRGHDLTTSLDNGKPVLYISPNGLQACRLCRKEKYEASKSE